MTAREKKRRVRCATTPSEDEDQAGSPRIWLPGAICAERARLKTPWGRNVSADQRPESPSEGRVQNWRERKISVRSRAKRKKSPEPRPFLDQGERNAHLQHYTSLYKATEKFKRTRKIIKITSPKPEWSRSEGGRGRPAESSGVSQKVRGSRTRSAGVYFGCRLVGTIEMDGVLKTNASPSKNYDFNEN